MHILAKLKSLLGGTVLFGIGFLTAVYLPVALALNSQAFLISQWDNALAGDFGCGENPNQVPPSGKVCARFFNMLVGGGHEDSDGGVSFSSTGNIFVKAEEPNVDYAVTIFGKKNGLIAYSEDPNSHGVVGVNADDDWGALGYAENNKSYGVYASENLYVGGGTLTDQIISPHTSDINVYPDGARPTVFVHGKLWVRDGCEGCDGPEVPEEDQPTVWITANPLSIESGHSTQLSWGSTNADGVNITKVTPAGAPEQCPDNGLPQSTGACFSRLTETTEFWATAFRGNMRAYASVVVEVTGDEDQPPATVTSFSVDDNELLLDESTRLRWITQNATSVTITYKISLQFPPEDAGCGTNPSGNCLINPENSRQYQLVAHGPGGSSAQSTLGVTVNMPEENEEDDPAPEYPVSGVTTLMCTRAQQGPICPQAQYWSGMSVYCDSGDQRINCSPGSNPTTFQGQEGCYVPQGRMEQSSVTVICLDNLPLH